MSERKREEPVEQAPPLFPSWNHWYALVIGFLIFLILAFYIFSLRLGG